MTLRRAAPSFVDSLSEEAALYFALGIEDGQLVETDNAIHHFYYWHVVHYLSSGTEWDEALPAGFMIGGSYWVQAHPDEEPFRILKAEEVAAIHKHLGALEEQTIDERFSHLLSGESQIYGGNIAEDSVGAFKGIFHQIKEFFSQAASNGQVVVKAIV